MNNIILVVSAVITIWFVYSILKELRIIRTLLELPLSAKDSYDKRLSEIDEKIKDAFALFLVTPVERAEALEARKIEFSELVKKQAEILEDRRKHFYVRPEYLKK